MANVKFLAIAIKTANIIFQKRNIAKKFYAIAIKTTNIIFQKRNIAKNNTSATKEWPPACVKSSCSILQLFKGEIFIF